MDRLRFDSWTRRRFGWSAGVGLVSLFSSRNVDNTNAKKKNKKRCRKLTKRCKVSGKRKRCCRGLRCDRVDYAENRRCCRQTQAFCEAETECCFGHECGEIFPGSGNRCCITGFGGVGIDKPPCQTDDDCCGGNVCFDGQCD